MAFQASGLPRLTPASFQPPHQVLDSWGPSHRPSCRQTPQRDSFSTIFKLGEKLPLLRPSCPRGSASLLRWTWGWMPSRWNRRLCNGLAVRLPSMTVGALTPGTQACCVVTDSAMPAAETRGWQAANQPCAKTAPPATIAAGLAARNAEQTQAVECATFR